MIMRNRKMLGLFTGLVLGSVVTLAGCEEKGPAEKAGEKVDQAAKDTKNALDPRGPMEKAGGKVDQAIGK